MLKDMLKEEISKELNQSRSQSSRYPCPAARETFRIPLDKCNAGSGNEIGSQQDKEYSAQCRHGMLWNVASRSSGSYECVT